MSNKLIDLSGLQEFKTQSDLKYQDKLTAGSNISISNDVISANPWAATYTAVMDSNPIDNRLSGYTIKRWTSVVLQPGKYFVVYTCGFYASTSGFAECGFSTNTTDITGFGRGWGDSRAMVANTTTQTCVSGVINCTSATTFYLLARHNSTAQAICYPRCYYIKFG